MNGTTLTTAHLGLLAGTVLECLPEGVTLETLNSWRLNKAEARKNMAFLADMAPEPKRKKKAKKPQQVNPAEFFVTSDAFYVDPDLVRNIDLSPCADDTREPKVLFALPRHMDDSRVAMQADGLPELTRRRITLPQLMHECRLALAGTPRLFVKGGYYLLYIEGHRGGLSPVRVYWDGKQLCLSCYRFDQIGGWNEGSQVCGN